MDTTLQNPFNRFEEFLGELSELSEAQLRTLAKAVNRAIRQKNDPTGKRERVLIQKIKHGGPSEDFWNQYGVFFKKSEANSLTSAERETYGALIDQSQQWAVERLRLINELAEMRNIHPDKILKQLDIQPRSF